MHQMNSELELSKNAFFAYLCVLFMISVTSAIDPSVALSSAASAATSYSFAGLSQAHLAYSAFLTTITVSELKDSLIKPEQIFFMLAITVFFIASIATPVGLLAFLPTLLMLTRTLQGNVMSDIKTSRTAVNISLFDKRKTMLLGSLLNRQILIATASFIALSLCSGGILPTVIGLLATATAIAITLHGQYEANKAVKKPAIEEGVVELY